VLVIACWYVNDNYCTPASLIDALIKLVSLLRQLSTVFRDCGCCAKKHRL